VFAFIGRPAAAEAGLSDGLPSQPSGSTPKKMTSLICANEDQPKQMVAGAVPG